MDTTAMVNYRLDNGQAFIEIFPFDEFEVESAFWIKESTSDKWRFYMVSPIVDAEGVSSAYLRLNEIISGMPQPYWMKPWGIRLIGVGEALARDVKSAFGRMPQARNGPTPWEGYLLGGRVVEEAYFYRIPAHAA